MRTRRDGDDGNSLSDVTALIERVEQEEARKGHIGDLFLMKFLVVDLFLS